MNKLILSTIFTLSLALTSAVYANEVKVETKKEVPKMEQKTSTKKEALKTTKKDVKVVKVTHKKALVKKANNKMNQKVALKKESHK